MSAVDDLNPTLTARELREIAALGDRGKWPLSATADDCLASLRRNLHSLADRLEQTPGWAGKDERLMNATEAAKHYRSTPEKLKQLAETGWPAAVLVGEQWRFRKL